MKIDHVAMYVQDIEVSKTFYETFFSATANQMYHNPKTGLKTYFLTFDSGARLEVMERPDMVKTHPHVFQQGLIHIAFNVGSKEAVDELTKRLLANGCTHISGPRTTGDGYYESCVFDPDGNQLEITI